MGKDGNLVVRDEFGVVRWASNTQVWNAWAFFDADGMLGLYPWEGVLSGPPTRVVSRRAAGWCSRRTATW